MNENQELQAHHEYVKGQTYLLVLWASLAAFMEFVQENAYGRENFLNELSASMNHQDSLAGAAVFGAGEHLLDLFAETIFPNSEKLRQIIPWALFAVACIYNLSQLSDPQYYDSTGMDIIASGAAITMARGIRKIFSGMRKK